MGVSTMNAPRTDKPDSSSAQSKDTGVNPAPFVRASDENVQGGNVDITKQFVNTGPSDLGVFDITAYGHLAYLHLLVEATGGAGAGATGTEDSPWNSLQNIALTEPNGAYIVQFPSGYEMFLANKYGGYFPAISADPRANVVFSAIAGTGGNFQFLLIVPVQLSGRDGLGALPNQDSSGQFKFRVTLAASTVVFATPPATTLPTARIRAWIQAWDQPEVQSAGMVNATAPPASGTTSFWQVQSGITVNAGENVIELKRKGNYIRQIIFVLRRGGTSRANAESDWPLETRFLRDAFPARYYNFNVWKSIMWQRTGYGNTADTKNGPENGIRFHDYMHEFDGLLGNENRDLWQPTRGSTRLEIAGSFANAGTLSVITNDVAIAEDVFL